jgi:hypothetical protein
MTRLPHGYELPHRLPPALARVLAYWEGLKRGQAEMPFWDDLNLADLPDLRDRLAVVEVFDNPRRFRLGVVGSYLSSSQGNGGAGGFLDEIALRPPLNFLHAQCSAAAEAAAPAYAALAPDQADDPTGRLVLPLWGEGQVRMLLVAVD